MKFIFFRTKIIYNQDNNFDLGEEINFRQKNKNSLHAARLNLLFFGKIHILLVIITSVAKIGIKIIAKYRGLFIKK